MQSKLSLFLIFLRLGFTSFGGPVAHIGYFRNEFVTRRRWFSEAEYADTLALCQLIPGPASSQVGLWIGYQRAGYLGALLAWLGFTLPSAFALGYLGLSLSSPGIAISPLLLGLLKTIALAVVLQAVIGMARSFCNTRLTTSLMLVSALILSLFTTPWITPALIIGAGVATLSLTKGESASSPMRLRVGQSSLAWLTLFFAGLLILPLLAGVNATAEMVNGFFRAGALVFGGGHVVLPLLTDATVNSGQISADVFISGYGAAQAVPGPLFTFAAFLGSALEGELIGALVATLAIFLPAVALLFGVLPLWEQIKSDQRIRITISGANAAVVGVLLAAFATLSIETVNSIYWGLGVVFAFVLIEYAKVPAWALVLATAAIALGQTLIS